MGSPTIDFSKYATPEGKQTGTIDFSKYATHENAPPVQAQVQQPSFGNQLTSAYNPGATEFGEKHPILGPAVRFLDAAGGAMLSTVPTMYHMVADQPTPEEIKQGQQEHESVTGITGRLPLIAHRLRAPVESAISAYQSGQVTPAAAMSVAPEALGTGLGTTTAIPAADIATRGTLRGLNRVLPSTTRAGLGLSLLTDEPEATYAKHPVEPTRALNVARKIEGELSISGEKPPVQIQNLINNASASPNAPFMNMYEARTLLKRVNDIVRTSKGFDDLPTRTAITNLKRFGGALDEDISKAAEQGGFGNEYEKLRNEYRSGSNIIRAGEAAGPVVGGAAGALLGRGAGALAATEAAGLGAVAGRYIGKPVIGGLVRGVIERNAPPRPLPPTPEAYMREAVGTAPDTREALAAKYGLTSVGEANRRIAKAGGKVKVNPLPPPQ